MEKSLPSGTDADAQLSGSFAKTIADIPSGYFSSNALDGLHLPHLSETHSNSCNYPTNSSGNIFSSNLVRF